MEANAKNTITTFEFLMRDIQGEAWMNNIPHFALPYFYGMAIEDLDTFLFNFYVLYNSYYCTSNAQKLKIFPTTLKWSTLQWFMGFGSRRIYSWDDMKKVFLNRYHNYYRSIEQREDIFKMTQKEDKSLEDFIEHFQCNL